MSSLRNKVDTQSEMMSAYFFIANTNKVDSNNTYNIRENLQKVNKKLINNQLIK